MAGRHCTICRRSDVAEINGALAENGSLRSISKRFGLSASSVFRHRSEHVPEMMAKAAAASAQGDLAQGDTLLQRVEAALGRVSDLQLEAELLFREAATTRDKTAALGATIGLFKEAREHLALLGKLVGTLMTGDSAAEVLGRQYGMTGSCVRETLESRQQVRAMSDEQLTKFIEEKHHVRIERIES